MRPQVDHFGNSPLNAVQDYRCLPPEFLIGRELVTGHYFVGSAGAVGVVWLAAMDRKRTIFRKQFQ